MKVVTVPADVYQQIERLALLVVKEPVWLNLSVKQFGLIYEQVEKIARSISSVSELMQDRKVGYVDINDDGVVLNLVSDEKAPASLVLCTDEPKQVGNIFKQYKPATVEVQDGEISLRFVHKID